MNGHEEAAMPRWFLPAAIVILLWEMAGCALYLMRVTVDPATLPSDQLPIYNATPAWVLAAFAVAVWSGLAGAVALLLRRRLAEPLLLVSFLALLVQNSVWLVVPEMREMVGSDDLMLPFVITVVCYGIWYFARSARKRGWLR
jgi:hypothetical protein